MTSDDLGEPVSLEALACQQDRIRRAGRNILATLVSAVTELLGPDLVLAGVSNGPGLVQVTATGGARPPRHTPPVLYFDDSGILDPASVLPGARDSAWSVLQVDGDLLGGVAVLHHRPLPANTRAVLSILAASAADARNRPMDLGGVGNVFDEALWQSPLGVAMLDLRPVNRGRVLRANLALARMLGYDGPGDLVGTTAADWVPPEDVTESRNRIECLMRGEMKNARYVKTYVRKDGSRFTAIVSTTVAGLGTDRPVLISHSLDITVQLETTRQLDRSVRHFQAAFDEAPHGMIIVTDGRAPESVGRIVRTNKAFAELVGVPAQELIGTRSLDLLVPEDRQDSTEAIRGVGTSGRTTFSQLRRLRHRDGRVLQVRASTAVLEAGGPDGPVLITHVQDVTRDVEHSRELTRLATTDPLTGAGNRIRLGQDLQALVSAGRGGGVLVIDLDRFKHVNDTLGHHVGDELLISVTRRLQATDPSWRVNRLGGDEFVVVIDRPLSPGQVQVEATNAAVTLTAPHLLPSGNKVQTSVSIGAAVADEPLTAEELHHRADLALRTARTEGRSAIVVCDQAVLDDATRTRQVQLELREALQENRVEAWLQPIMDLTTGRVFGYEALARIRDGQGRVTPAQDFIKVAEQTGLISEVDHLVVAEVARMRAEDPRLWDPAVKVALNVSSQTLTQPSFLIQLGGLLSVRPRHPNLILEVTEHSLLEDDPQVRVTFDWMRGAGIELAVDDFGTGYSALAYLRRFRMQHLKVDHSFVSSLGQAEGAETTVQAIIEVAHAHQMTVIAEGIESAEQARMLVSMGCDLGQGHHFGSPRELPS